jgi:hypothetical protein
LNRTKAIVVLLVLLVITAGALVFTLLPKHYSVGQSLPQAWAFWGRNDAFIFLSLNTIGRSHNAIQDKIAATRYGYWTGLLGGYPDFAKQDVIAYHLTANGQLDRYALPEHTTLFGTWSFENGRPQLVPVANPGANTQGFRWNGQTFVSVPAATPQSGTPRSGTTTLTADDLEEDGSDFGLMSEAARQQLKSAGWHYKYLTGYRVRGSNVAILPVQMGGSAFNLTIENTSFDKSDFANFDFLLFGAKSLRISGDSLAGGEQTLWSQSGWKRVTKAEYERLRGYRAPRHALRSTWAWLAIALVLITWKFWGWFHVLFKFGSVKQRVLQSMATSFSFPPATPSQFPLLDLAALDQYTRELEGMGFTRLLDFSLVSDAPNSTPSFCRLFAHTRNHCFALVNQFFPRGKASMPLKCALESMLQDGWSIAFADRKPQAAASLLRRRKAIGVSMPGAHLSELLQAFLKMRDQMCLDLGISPLKDDTLEAYITKTQRAAGELREAVQEKNLAKGLSEVYLRKFSLLRTKPEYVWLGDYPKEAERRKQGLSSFSGNSR